MFGICNHETLKAEHTNSCWDCDQEVIFRYIKGVCRKLRVSGSCGEYRKKAIPVKCRKCSQMVYYVEHNGGSVWFDELGPPWPKHPCFIGEARRVNVQSQLATKSAQPTEDYDRTVRLTKRCEFCGATLKLTHYASHLNSEHNKIIPAHNFTQHKAKHIKLPDHSPLFINGSVWENHSKKLRNVPPISIPKATKVKKPLPAMTEAKDLPASNVPTRDRKSVV